jgi:hypothetical protein
MLRVLSSPPKASGNPDSGHEPERANPKEEVMKMRYRSTPFLAALLCLLPVAASAQLTPYTQDFESLVAADPAALDNDGWFVFGNVYLSDGTTYEYGYGPFPAPNYNLAFCQIVQLEGGVDQGAQQLSVFSDYENVDHGAGKIIESNVYREWTVDAGDVGSTWCFQFQAKMGNLVEPSTAAAFIKTLDPNAGYNLTNLITRDMTTIPTTWAGYTLFIHIDSSLVGQILQIGFLNRASNYVSSGIFYDNLVFDVLENIESPTDAPNAGVRGLTLSQNYPNPFNPSTEISYSVEHDGYADLAVYDLAGRRVATLFHGSVDTGDHTAIWSGRDDQGNPVASGHYRYVLRTAEGQVARGMTLLK